METPPTRGRRGPASDGPDGPIDARDERHLAALAELVDHVDPVPPGLVERARFAVALEELDVEVASLLDTSAEHPSDLAGVRGTATDGSLTMTFASEATTVTLAVTGTGREKFRVDGWLTGGGEVDVTLRRPGSSQAEHVGEDGRFVFDDVPAGMVQVIVAAPDGHAAVVTPVFEL